MQSLINVNHDPIPSQPSDKNGHEKDSLIQIELGEYNRLPDDATSPQSSRRETETEEKYDKFYPNMHKTQMKKVHHNNSSIFIQRDYEKEEEEAEHLYKHKHSENTNKKSYIKSSYKLFTQMFIRLMNRTERRLLFFILFCISVSGLFRLIFFIYIGSIIDLLSDKYDTNHVTYSISCNIHEYVKCTGTESMIHVFVVTLIVLSVMLSLVKFAQSISLTLVSCRFLERLNCLVFDIIINQWNILTMVNTKTQKRNLRYLLSNEMKHLNLSIYAIIEIIESLIHAFCGLFYLFVLNPDIAGIIVLSFLVILVTSLVYIKNMDIMIKLRKASFKIVISFISEMLNYITTIKTFSKEDDESFVYSLYIKRAFKYELKRNNLLSKYQFVLSIIIYFTILSIIWYGCFMVSIGMLVIDLFILLQLNLSIYNIVTISPLIITKYTKSLKKIIDILKEKETENETDLYQVQKPNDYIPVCCDIRGKIDIRNITFSYPNQNILNNISMQMHPSSVTALVGEIGSGKSTILKLLMRFFKPQSGQIDIDGIDISEYNLAFIHSQIGYVSQSECHLFDNRSISDNIKFGIRLYSKDHYLFHSECFNQESMYFWRRYKSITQTHIENVCKIANAHSFIIKLKDGYKTIVGGDGGINLSQGQKHRIGIARALLLNPKILLINENGFNFKKLALSFSSKTDHIVNGKCVVVIANRLETVKNADVIYVIQNGTIVQRGPHTELMQNVNGHYYQLMQRQTFSWRHT